MLLFLLGCSQETLTEEPDRVIAAASADSFMIQEAWLNLANTDSPTVILPGETGPLASIRLLFFSAVHPYEESERTQCEWVGAFNRVVKDADAPYWRGDLHLTLISHDCDLLLSSDQLERLGRSWLTLELQPLLDSQKNTLQNALFSAGRDWSEYRDFALGVRAGVFSDGEGPLLERQWGVVYPLAGDSIAPASDGSLVPVIAGQLLNSGALRFFSMAPIEMGYFPQDRY